MATENSRGPESLRQPFLPRTRLIWSFVAVTAAAVLIMLVRWADQGVALIAALVAIAAWVAGLFAMFSLLFLITYFLGVLENLLAPPENEVLSPFAQDRLPEQIVAPNKVDVQ
ncbi:MAG: hypothetical protein IT423_07080 [Pirellulaceae bacterium]|nr:hypothetical protein [Pirellulaceae bacterium]